MRELFGFKKTAKKLELIDLEKAPFLDRTCPECGLGLRFGQDSRGSIWSYCPKCQKRIETVLIPRFSETIRLLPHDD